MGQAAGQGAEHQHCPMLVWTGWGAGISKAGFQDHRQAPQLWPSHPRSPERHLPDHTSSATATPTDQMVWAGPQPPSPGQCYRGPGHSPKPAGGCWRGFCGPSPGSGWPRPHPPTAPGCGARWGRTHVTRSSCGCPPATTEDRAHRRHEASGVPGTPLCTSLTQTSRSKKSRPPPSPGSGTCDPEGQFRPASPWAPLGLRQLSTSRLAMALQL